MCLSIVNCSHPAVRSIPRELALIWISISVWPNWTPLEEFSYLLPRDKYTLTAWFKDSNYVETISSVLISLSFQLCSDKFG